MPVRFLHVPRERRGGAMLLVVFAMALAVAVSGLMLMNGATVQRDAERRYDSTRALFLADGAIEHAKHELAVALANFEEAPLEGTAVISGVEVDYRIDATGFSTIETDASGLRTMLDGYRIEATAEWDGDRVTSHQIVNAESTPIFQFAVFYEGDLEIFPGPSMTIGGRVHTNSDLYLGSNGTLTLDTNYVRAGGGMYRNRKDDPTVTTGTVDIRRWVADPFDPSEPKVYQEMYGTSGMSKAGVPAAAGYGGYDSNFTSGLDKNGDGDFDDLNDLLPWAPGALEFWSEPLGYTTEGNTVKDAAHETPTIVPPDLRSISMYDADAGGDHVFDSAKGEYVEVASGTGTHSKGFFHEEAGLAIVGKDDGSWTATDENGVDITSSLASVVTVTKTYDSRQGGNVPVVQIDLEQLNASGEFPVNGLIYASMYGMGTGTDARGVHLRNGSELLGPLTVVTEGPVYVEGDYNTVKKQPAAVISDAVNLLSNSWDGSKGGIGLPNASDTTYNVAFVTGNHDTVGKDYNGGLENLPRFHEDWSARECKLVGSFVDLWESRYATGTWQYGGNRYTAPKRNWSFDPDFNNSGNLPPYTPMAVAVVDVATW